MRTRFLSLSLLLLLGPMVTPANGAVEIYRGDSMSCQPLLSIFQKNWFEIKKHLIPISGTLTRAKDEDFVCVDRRATEQSQEIRLAMSSELRCFKHPLARGAGFCCDARISSCAALNPALFPEAYRQPKRDAPERQPSDWVKPPSDNDQWNSN
ncbi:MAG: hypothetical protein ACI8Z1_003207 [Candidatus Azotimanducaceae bacterium]|jgi:hypothetical protein